MNVAKCLKIAVILTLAPTGLLAEMVVSHYEPLQQTHISVTDKNGLSFSSELQQPAAVEIRFDALGRTFDLRLENNDRVSSALDSDAAKSGIGVYRGQLANNPDSWARIVVFEGIPRGLIWDGVEMFAVEAPGDSALAIDSPVIFRVADAYIVPGTMTCGADSLSGNAAKIVQNMSSAAKIAIARAPGAISEITMSAIGDYEFTNLKGGDLAAEAALRARLNNVDGYFSEQVGVQINVQLYETHSDVNDPFGDSLDAATLLDDLSLYREQTNSHNSLGVTHLYTGRNITAPTVGIAWRGLLCNDYFSAGLSEGRDTAFIDSLIAAHEIGHNFGAEHDGVPGTPCEADTGMFIMSPSVSGSQTFSDCSIAVMQAEAAGASCVVALPAVDVSVTPVAQVSNVLLGASTDFIYRVSSNGTVAVSGVMADFTLPNSLTLDSVAESSGSGICTSGAGTASCDLGDLPGLSSRTITIAATPTAVGIGTFIATVSTTDTDERPSNDQDAVQLSVDPAVDLVVNTPTSAAVFVDAVTTVDATLQNLSILDASNVALNVTLEVGLQATAATWSIGTCTVTAQQIDCQAANFAAGSSSSLSITATGTTTGRKDVTVTLSSTEADANPGNNSAQGEVRVVSERNDKDDGGGAANPVLLLLALFAMLSARRRQVRI